MDGGSCSFERIAGSRKRFGRHTCGDQGSGAGWGNVISYCCQGGLRRNLRRNSSREGIPKVRDGVVCTPAGVMETISVVAATEEVRVPWVVCTVETEEEGGDVTVGMTPTLVTVEAEVMDEVTLLIEVTVVIGLSVWDVVV